MKRILTFLLLGFATTAMAGDTVVILVDTSGSMGEYMGEARQTRMQVAKTALKEVLAQTPDTTQVGLLTFNGWIYPVSPVDKDKLGKAIDSMGPGGGTPLFEYMRGGGTELTKTRNKNNNLGMYKLLVVTDGEASDSYLNDSNGKIPGVIDDIVGRGFVIDAIGLDMGSDHSLKKDINGRYMRGDDQESLKKAVRQAVAEVGFKDSDSVDAQEGFAEIGEFSEEFSIAVLAELGTFRNHPIGEAPPVVKVVEPTTGEIIDVPNPDAIEEVAELGTEGNGLYTILGILACIVVGIVFLGIFLGSRR